MVLHPRVHAAQHPRVHAAQVLAHPEAPLLLLHEADEGPHQAPLVVHRGMVDLDAGAAGCSQTIAPLLHGLWNMHQVVQGSLMDMAVALLLHDVGNMHQVVQ